MNEQQICSAIYDEIQQEESITQQIIQKSAEKPLIITQIPSDNMILDAIDNKFNNLIKVEDKNEAKKIKEYIGLFIKKKRDYKFTIQPTYNTLFELAANFCVQVVPILKYLIIRFGEQQLPKYQTRIIEILQSVETDRIINYYNKLNGSFYGKTILYNKLHMIIQENEKRLHMIILLVYALLPFKDKPIKPGTVGVSEREFEEIYNE